MHKPSSDLKQAFVGQNQYLARFVVDLNTTGAFVAVSNCRKHVHRGLLMHHMLFISQPRVVMHASPMRDKNKEYTKAEGIPQICFKAILDFQPMC